MFERFTEEAVRALFFAQASALEANANFIEPENLLAGVLRAAPATMSATTPAAPPVDAILCRLRLNPPGEIRQSDTREIPFAPVVQRLLNIAAAEADRLGHHRIRPEHLLLAFLGERWSRTTRALRRAGVNREALIACANRAAAVDDGPIPVEAYLAVGTVSHSHAAPPARARVFTWRNWFRRPPGIEIDADSPLTVVSPKYFTYASVGSRVGSLLRFDVLNRSNRPVHSYAWRHSSPVLHCNGAFGVHPEGGLLAGQSHTQSLTLASKCALTLTIDFVQFADGATWFSTNLEATVKSTGVDSGALAAATHMLGVLEARGPEAVISSLSSIHRDVPDVARQVTDSSYGTFGFYCGVTNVAVRLQRAYDEGGVQQVESLLRSFNS